MSLVVALSRQDLHEGNIVCDPQTGLPIYAWSRDATIVNRVDARFDFNRVGLVAGDFARRQVYVADASKSRYGLQQSVDLQLRGVDTTQGGIALMDQLALAYLQRWGYAPPLLRLSAIYATHTLEPGDRIPVTHALITNPIDGTLGLDRALFEVLDVTPTWLTEGKVDLLLLWVGAIETSAVPTGTLANLVPGLSSVDGTDVPVPLSGSITLTSAASISKIRIGLKRTSYRAWSALKRTQIRHVTKDVDECLDGSDTHVPASYTGSTTYRMEYKTSTAPDSAGSGGNPTTGWVELLASKTVGSVSLFQLGLCGWNDIPLPSGQSFFNEYFPTLGASPNTYNVKIFYTAAGAQGNPGNLGGPCTEAPCSDTYISTSMIADGADLIADYIESIT